MRAKIALLCSLAATALLLAAAPAQADFGLAATSAAYDADSGGSPATAAGAHPYDFTTHFTLNSHPDPGGSGHQFPDADLKDIAVSTPPGFVLDSTAVPTCDYADFILSTCSPDTQVGTVDVALFDQDLPGLPLFNLTPASGSVAKLGFLPVGVFVTIDAGLDPQAPYRGHATVANVSQLIATLASTVTVWGYPADPAHDAARGAPSGAPLKPFLTLPRSCSGPLTTSFSADSWQDPGNFISADAGSPALTGCPSLGFDPAPAAAPSTDVADSPSGFDFSIDVDDPGLTDPTGTAKSDLKKAVVTLPQGITVNPAAANGLGACSPAQLAQESAASDFGSGCPASSRIATVAVTTPLLSDQLSGSVFLATPYDNPFDTLLAGYLVIKDPARGVFVALAGKITADPNTGQLVASFDQNPQLPFDHLQVNFKTGPHAPLLTPATCGDYQIDTELTPWSGTAPIDHADGFQITSSPSGGDCPSTPASQPNSPSFDAGTISPISNNYSPLVVDLRRPDGSQRFKSVTVAPPPGLLGKLAGVPACSEAQIAAAQSRSNPGDGAAEQSDPSCPASSRVGTVHVAAGAGPDPYWAQGTAYLAGPYNGAPLSFVIITPAVAGPFDLGVVVTRVAVAIDPATAQITAVSDPIPAFLDGIALDVTQAKIAIDRDSFTRTGTSCDPSSFTGQLLSDQDQAAQLSAPFQLSDCSRLAFKPKLAISLRGGTKRNGHPALTTVLRARSGDADIRKAGVILPPTMQLDQSHIQAPCTRPQFAQNQCPAASVIGSVTATSPLVDYPLSGPVYLRTGDNPLPDVVLDLHGPPSQPIHITQVGKVDTVHARLRTTFDAIPDAPIAKATIRLLGGSKGLLVNNTDLCAKPDLAAVRLIAHNNATSLTLPTAKVAGCKKHKAKKHKAKKHKAKKHKHHKRHRRHRRAAR